MKQKMLLPRMLAVVLTSTLTACASGGAVQPDRSVFSLDGNYQRYEYGFPIEETFDRTIKVFKEAGYRFDVVDRATGQISGERARSNDGGSNSDKGLKFYALVLPTPAGQSQVAVKIVQVIKQGSIVGSAKTEIIVNDAQMYQYAFRRIADVDLASPTAPRPVGPAAQQAPGQWNAQPAAPRVQGPN